MGGVKTIEDLDLFRSHPLSKRKISSVLCSMPNRFFLDLLSISRKNPFIRHYYRKWVHFIYIFTFNELHFQIHYFKFSIKVVNYFNFSFLNKDSWILTGLLFRNFLKNFDFDPSLDQDMHALNSDLSQYSLIIVCFIHGHKGVRGVEFWPPYGGSKLFERKITEKRLFYTTPSWPPGTIMYLD